VGRNLIINSNKVNIDGQDVTPDVKEITITVSGDITTLNVDYAKEIQVQGSVGHVKTTSGDVWCGNVTGDVKSTSGDIECDTVQGNAETVSGDIKAALISGNAKTLSGDIKYKK